MNEPPGPGRRAALGLVLACGVIAPVKTSAQAVFRFTPSISTAQMYDDNLFFRASDRQADFITRVRPEIDSEYRLPLWILSGRYGFDIERFARHSELTSAHARQDAAAGLEYRPTERLVVAAASGFSRTRRPGELTPLTGLSFARAAAQRFAANSSITRRLSSSATSSIAYAFTEDRVEGYAGIRTHAATLNTKQRLSSRQTLTAAYQFSRFLFGASSSMSHALNLAWTRAMTSRTSLLIGGGPIVTDASPGLDAAMSLHHRTRPVDLALAYARTQTTVFGLAGIVRTQGLSATTAWRLPHAAQIQIMPAFYQSARDGLRADVYRLLITAAFPLSAHISLESSLDASHQRGDLYRRLGSQAIPRHEAIIRVVAHAPQRRQPVREPERKPRPAR